jgi:hypothetical protein
VQVEGSVGIIPKADVDGVSTVFMERAEEQARLDGFDEGAACAGGKGARPFPAAIGISHQVPPTTLSLVRGVSLAFHNETAMKE